MIRIRIYSSSAFSVSLSASRIRKRIDEILSRANDQSSRNSPDTYTVYSSRQKDGQRAAERRGSAEKERERESMQISSGADRETPKFIPAPRPRGYRRRRRRRRLARVESSVSHKRSGVLHINLVSSLAGRRVQAAVYIAGAKGKAWPRGTDSRSSHSFLYWTAERISTRSRHE